MKISTSIKLKPSQLLWLKTHVAPLEFQILDQQTIDLLRDIYVSYLYEFEEYWDEQDSPNAFKPVIPNVNMKIEMNLAVNNDVTVLFIDKHGKWQHHRIH